MEKNKLLLVPLFLGAILVVYSWYLSYPLLIDSVDDLVFNHVSVLYWFGLSLMLPSMYMIAVISKSNCVKWIMTVGIIIAMYSINFFYSRLPHSDSHFVRGMTENFIMTKKLDPTQPNLMYFQWPSLFILADIVTSITGLKLANVESLIYLMIGILLVTSLYIYASKKHKRWGFIAVIAFFFMLYSYFNYQFAPFSLAFALLLILIVIESQKKRPMGPLIIVISVLFIGISIAHAFVPVFFILYLLIQLIIGRSKQHGSLFLLTLIIYLGYNLFVGPPWLLSDFINIISLDPSSYDIYSSIIEIMPAATPIDAIAQMFTAASTIAIGMICLLGFVISFTKSKLTNLDKLLFLTGVAYSGLGIIFYVLGSRAIPIALIPISLGAAYLFESRFTRILKLLFLILLVLFPLIPLHLSFFDSTIAFQTEEAYQAENFMIDHYNWTNHSLILAHFRVITYLQTKQSSVAEYESDFSILFPRIKDYDSIVYTVGLGKNLLIYNYTTERILSEQKFNMVYNNGFSYIATKSSNLS